MVRFVAVLAGAVGSTGLWLLLLPWDLSEVWSDGRLIGNGADDHAVMIALVAGVVVVVAIGLLMVARTRRTAVWFSIGGMVTWAALFAWRAGASETVGANMFMIPLLFAVIPLTIAVPFVVRGVSRWLDERR